MASKPMPPHSKLPYVALACVCEKILREQDGVFSAIRIVDTFKVVREPPAGLKPMTDLNVLVSVKSRDHQDGNYTMRLVLSYPSGKQQELPVFEVPLKHGHAGHTVAANLAVEIREYGRYYFDVLWGDVQLTRIPFEIKPAEKSTQANPT